MCTIVYKLTIIYAITRVYIIIVLILIKIVDILYQSVNNDDSTNEQYFLHL